MDATDRERKATHNGCDTTGVLEPYTLSCTVSCHDSGRTTVARAEPAVVVVVAAQQAAVRLGQKLEVFLASPLYFHTLTSALHPSALLNFKQHAVQHSSAMMLVQKPGCNRQTL